MYKILLLAAVIMAGSFSAANAQFFKPLAKPVLKLKAALPSGVTAIDSSNLTQNAWRPIVVAAAYSEPGSILMAGTGFGYQHLSWNVSSQAWVCKWSVNGVAFAGGSTIPTTPASVMSVGILGGIDNNLIMAGPVYNFGTKQIGVGISIGINLNNGAGL